MHHLIFVVTLALLLGISLAESEYIGLSAVGCAVAMGWWFYFSLRGTGRSLRDAWPGAIATLAIFVVCALFLANSATDESSIITGMVTNCVSSTQRSTGHTGITCTAKLQSGSVQRFATDTTMSPGTVVQFEVRSRRILGNHYAFAGTR